MLSDCVAELEPGSFPHARVVARVERCWWEVALEQGMGSACVSSPSFSTSTCRLA